MIRNIKESRCEDKNVEAEQLPNPIEKSNKPILSYCNRLRKIWILIVKLNKITKQHFGFLLLFVAV